MRVTLHVLCGPAGGRRIHLFSGQVGRFGRTEWADFAFPDDEDLAEVHFAVQCEPAGPRLYDLHSETGTQLNGEPVTDAPMGTGDEIAAGTTRFRVEVDGLPRAATEEDNSPANSTEPESRQKPVTAAAICEAIALEDEAQALLTKTQSPREFAAVLAEQGLWRDGIRFAAARLPREEAIRWGCRCLREFCGQRLSALEQEALQTAEQWAKTSEEDVRREAERLAEQDAHQSPAGWLATAAFWSGHSLAPPDAEVVPPAAHLAPTAVAAALLLAAAEAPPLEIELQLKRFLAKAGERLES